MPEDFVKRDEFQGSIQRVHERVDTVEKTTAQIEVSAKNIEKCVYDIHSLLYGKNGNDGFIVITKVQTTKLFERIGLHSKMIILIVFSIIGLAFYVLQKVLIK